MIEIQLSHALALYAGALAAMIAVIWIYTAFSVRRTHLMLEKQNLWRCTFCGYTYLDESAASLSKCPRCASFNSSADAQEKIVQHGDPDGSVGHAPQVETGQVRRNPSQRKRKHQRRRGPRKR